MLTSRVHRSISQGGHCSLRQYTDPPGEPSVCSAMYLQNDSILQRELLVEAPIRCPIHCCALCGASIHFLVVGEKYEVIRLCVCLLVKEIVVVRFKEL